MAPATSNINAPRIFRLPTSLHSGLVKISKSVFVPGFPKSRFCKFFFGCFMMLWFRLVSLVFFYGIAVAWLHDLSSQRKSCKKKFSSYSSRSVRSINNFCMARKSIKIEKLPLHVMSPEVISRDFFHLMPNTPDIVQH